MHLTSQPAGGHSYCHSNLSVLIPSRPAMHRRGEIDRSHADSLFLAAGALAESPNKVTTQEGFAVPCGVKESQWSVLDHARSFLCFRGIRTSFWLKQQSDKAGIIYVVA